MENMANVFVNNKIKLRGKKSFVFFINTAVMQQEKNCENTQ